MNAINQMKKALFVALILIFSAGLFPLCLSAQNLIPRPNSYIAGEGKFLVKQNTSIGYTDAVLRDAANYLASELGPSTGYKIKVQKKAASITLSLDNSMKENEYRLVVNPESIVIVGGDYRGVIYGIQTLRQLMPLQTVSKTAVSGVEWAVPACTVEDSPRFNYRGLELDVSRHFFTKAEVEQLLDFMAFYKMNKFHWHLTDDQGWRVEIKRYPKLTERGAWRKYNSHDKECNRRAKDEDNDDMLVPTDRYKIIDGEKQYGGFYTQKEIREIVDYARVRGIDVIPEVDMPGHMLAAEENYKGLACTDDIGFKFFSSPVCPGKETAMEFCKNVYDEIVSLFPYEYVHIGGDEVEKTNWKNCPDCQKRIKDHDLKNEEELQSWFIHEMEIYLNAKGRKMIGWNEIIEGGLSKTSTIMWWGSWVKDVPEVTTAHGNDLIFTPNTHFYLDYLGSDADIKKIYNFDATAGLPADRQKHLLGVQGNIWTEFIPTMNRVFYMSSMRALAIAELGWTDAEPKNYYAFEERLVNELPRLRQLGVKYRIFELEGFNATNAFVGEGRYHVTCKDPSATIRYTTDGSIPTAQSPLLDKELVLHNSAEIIFRTFHADGSKGDITKASFVKDTYSQSVDINPKHNGLNTVWHEFDGANTNDIEKAKVNGTYRTADVSIPEEVKDNIGLITTGYIYVPETAIYTFVLTSDDGSDLEIDGVTVLDMNREQPPTTAIGEKALTRGYHKIRVRYFDHNGGTLKMIVKDAAGTVLEPVELYFCE